MVMSTGEAPTQKMSLRDVPVFNDVNSMLSAVKSLLTADGSALKEYPDQVDQVLQGIQTHTIMMQNHMRLLMNEPVRLEQVHATYVADTMMLELANGWWKSHKLALDAPINMARNAMMVAFVMVSTTPKLLTESEWNLVYLQTTKRYDFIPWVVFVATGNLGLYGAAELLLSKWRKGQSFEGFLNTMRET